MDAVLGGPTPRASGERISLMVRRATRRPPRHHDHMTTQRRLPIKRTALRKVERRDCKVCGRRVGRRQRNADWAHVRAPKPPHRPTPYASKRTPKRTSLMRQADAMWSRAVRLRAGRCEACGRAPQFGDALSALEAAHIIPRRHRTTRWDPANGRALCRTCHRHYTANEKAWRDFIGPDWDRLWVKAQELWDRDYAKVVAELRADPRSVAEATEP